MICFIRLRLIFIIFIMFYKIILMMDMCCLFYQMVQVISNYIVFNSIARVLLVVFVIIFSLVTDVLLLNVKYNSARLLQYLCILPECPWKYVFENVNNPCKFNIKPANLWLDTHVSISSDVVMVWFFIGLIQFQGMFVFQKFEN